MYCLYLRFTGKTYMCVFLILRFSQYSNKSPFMKKCTIIIAHINFRDRRFPEISRTFNIANFNIAKINARENKCARKLMFLRYIILKMNVSKLLCFVQNKNQYSIKILFNEISAPLE